MIQTSLVLGGGAARGFAHIGVVRRLQHHDVMVSEVIGTSMGSIIGACYALGFSAEKMLETASDVSILSLVDVSLGGGPVKGEKLWRFLEGFFDGATFADTRIPLKIVSVDVNGGELYIFDKGKISDAIRASVSIPGVISPYQRDDKVLVDGGVLANLALQCVTGDRAIAVSVIQPLSDEIRTTTHIWKWDIPRPSLSYTVALLRRTMSLMIAENEKRSRESFDRPLCLLQPDLSGVGYTDFRKCEIAEERGYVAADKHLASWL